MSIFDDWAKYITRILREESELAGSIVSHRGELGSAREALIRGVLSRILPHTFLVGTGEIIDSIGGRSKQIDVVISRAESPSLLLPNGSRVFLIESVIATIEVKSRLTGGRSGTLREALNNCASVADLTPTYKPESIEALMQRLNAVRVEGGAIRFENPFDNHLYSTQGYPAAYILGFRNSVRRLAQAILDWKQARVAEGKDFLMRHVPSVIAAESTAVIRNAPPFLQQDDATRARCLALVGTDESPLRMLIAHLLYTIQQTVPCSATEGGLRSNASNYLGQTIPFNYQQVLFCDLDPIQSNS